MEFNFTRKWLNLFIITLLFLTGRVYSDVSISKPLTGQTYQVSSGKVTVPISWIESNAVPKLSNIKSYTFTLCSGPNSDIFAVHKLADGISSSDITDFSYEVDIDSSYGKDGQYYVQVYAEIDKGYTIHYTNRFTLKGMTGSYTPSVGAITDPPSGQTSIAGTGQTGIASIDSRSFSVSYTMQTGLTRYAPMQLQPGSTVTKDKSQWSRRYPTSAVTYYTSLRPSPSQVSTITPGWSYTMSSLVNYASPALSPSANGGWYNPSSKLVKPTVSTPSEWLKAQTTSKK